MSGVPSRHALRLHGGSMRISIRLRSRKPPVKRERNRAAIRDHVHSACAQNPNRSGPGSPQNGSRHFSRPGMQAERGTMQTPRTTGMRCIEWCPLSPCTSLAWGKYANLYQIALPEAASRSEAQARLSGIASHRHGAKFHPKRSRVFAKWLAPFFSPGNASGESGRCKRREQLG